MNILNKQNLEDEYIMKDHSVKHLKSLGFHRYSIMCDEESSYYIYKFSVYKYLGTTTLECEIKVDINTGEIRVDVHDMDHEVFSPFYDEQNPYKSFVSKINNVILEEFKKLGIKEKKK